MKATTKKENMKHTKPVQAMRLKTLIFIFQQHVASSSHAKHQTKFSHYKKLVANIEQQLINRLILVLVSTKKSSSSTVSAYFIFLETADKTVAASVMVQIAS